MDYLISPAVKAVFFDLNGTLIRDKAAHHLVFEQMIAEYGISLSAEERERKVANRMNRELWPAVFERPMDEGELVAISTVQEHVYFKQLPIRAHPVPGARELIARLKQRHVHVGLVTGAPLETAKYVIRYLGLEAMFDDLITSEHLSHGKPDPEAYTLALRNAGVASKFAVAFEDSPQGIHAAIAAGIETVGVAPEYPEAMLLQSGAVAVITDFSEVF